MNTNTSSNSHFVLHIFLASLSGLLLGLASNQIYSVPLAPLAWISLVPLFFSLKAANTFKEFFFYSTLFSFVFLLLAGISFILASAFEGILSIIISAVIFSIPLLILYLLKKLFAFRKSLLFLPLLWPLTDWVLIEKIFAMPNLSISMNQAPLTSLIQYIDLTGFTGITFWLVTLNVTIYLQIEDWKILGGLPSKLEKLRAIRKSLAVLVLLFVIPFSYNFYVSKALPSSFTGAIKVSVVQSNYPDQEIFGDSTFHIGFSRLIDLTDSLISESKPDLIIWPESAVPLDLKKRADIHTYLFQKVLQWETPLLTGTTDTDTFIRKSSIPKLQKYLNTNYKIYNSAVMITPQLAWMALEEGLDIQQLKVYRKQNLMPFTEYVPLAESLPVLSNLMVDFGNSQHLSAGSGPTSLRFASRNQKIIDVSPLICWDILFSSSSSNISLQNTDFIAAISNESPFGDTFSTSAYEVENFTRLRSIENRRSVAKASTTGYSLFTDPFGKVYSKIPWYTTDIQTEFLTISNSETVFSKYPSAFPWFCIAASISIFVIQNKQRMIKPLNKKLL